MPTPRPRPVTPGTATPPEAMVCWIRVMRNCKIAMAEERLGMSVGGTTEGAGTGTGSDGIALGKVCPTLEIVRLGVGVAVGRSLRIDVRDAKQKGKVLS